MHRRTAALVAGLVISTSVTVTALLVVASRPGTAIAPSATDGEPVSGPAVVAWYDVSDVDGLALYQVRLDGRSQAELIADRPRDDESITAWEVEPSGRAALFRRDVAVGIDVEVVAPDGTSRGWNATVAVRAPMEGGVWAPDGRTWAIAGTRPEDDGIDAPRGRLAIVDVASGAVRTVDIDRDLWLQGFDDGGRPILTQRSRDRQGVTDEWTFWAFDADLGEVVRLPTGIATGPPRSVSAEDVAPSAGLAVLQDGRHGQDEEPGPPLALIDLRTGIRHAVGPQGVSLGWIGFTRDGRSILAFSSQAEDQAALDVIALDGTIRRAWNGPSRPVGSPVEDATGAYVGWTGWTGRSVITVLDVAQGRSVDLALPDRIIEAKLDAITGSSGSGGLAVAPGPTRSPVPPRPSADAIPDAPRLGRTWLETGDVSRTVHATLFRPASTGGIALVAEMPPIILSGLGGDWPADTSLTARPGSDDVLVVVDDAGTSGAWLWTPGGERRPLALPAGFPRHFWWPRWDPTGARVAFQAEAAIDVDNVRQIIAILDTGTVTSRIVMVPPRFSGLVDWTPDARGLLVSNGPCTESCGVRYAYRSTIDIASGTVHEQRPGDHERVDAYYVHGADETGVMLSSIELETSDDIRLTWPVDLRPADGWMIEVAPGGRDLIASRIESGRRAIYLIVDPLASARDGVASARLDRLTTVRPGLGVGSPDPSLRWSVARDAVGTFFLVDFSSGEGTEIGDDQEGWLDWLR